MCGTHGENLLVLLLNLLFYIFSNVMVVGPVLVPGLQPQLIYAIYLQKRPVSMLITHVLLLQKTFT